MRHFARIGYAVPDLIFRPDPSSDRAFFVLSATALNPDSSRQPPLPGRPLDPQRLREWPRRQPVEPGRIETDSFDEGRVAERILIAAAAHGLSSAIG